VHFGLVYFGSCRALPMMHCTYQLLAVSRRWPSFCRRKVFVCVLKFLQWMESVGTLADAAQRTSLELRLCLVWYYISLLSYVLKTNSWSASVTNYASKLVSQCVMMGAESVVPSWKIVCLPTVCHWYNFQLNGEQQPTHLTCLTHFCSRKGNFSWRTSIR
jgi:hypothetical protein